MLQAKSKTGILIMLASLPRDKIKEIRNNPFYCPECKERVIIKAGKQVIPHFAHVSKVSCSSGGGEGAYHEKGKLLLFQWLKAQNLHVQLEKHLPDINQIPDILLTINNKKIAIEYQCARISNEEIRSRNEGYRKMQITPIWILGANRFQRLGHNELRVDQHTINYIHQFPNVTSPMLFYFCPNTIQFISFQHLYFSTNNRVIGKFNYQGLADMSFLQVFDELRLNKEELYTVWKKKKKTFRLRRRMHLRGRELKWHQWLYERQTHINNLPSIIYLPVQEQWKMKSPLWEWQSRLVIDLFNHVPIKKTFSLKQCKVILNNDFQATPIDSPIKHYLHLLELLNIIKQTSYNIFQKTNEILYNETIDQSLINDQLVMKKLISKS